MGCLCVGAVVPGVAVACGEGEDAVGAVVEGKDECADAVAAVCVDKGVVV